MSLDARARDRLQTQGFSCQRPGFESVEPWLRVTPALSTAVILVGTVTGSAPLLWLFAIISGFASTRRVHPFDQVSNVVRNRDEKDPLPINPPPRRFAMAVAALWAAGTGVLFASGLLTAGYLSGGGLSIAGLTVAATHFCLGSWLYQRLRELRSSR